MSGDDRRPIGEVPARFTSARDIRSRPVTVTMQRLQNTRRFTFQRNNKNDAHLTISGAAGESHERYEPITQFGRGRDGFRLYHGNHCIDMRRFEPEFLVAVDLPLR